MSGKQLKLDVAFTDTTLPVLPHPLALYAYDDFARAVGALGSTTTGNKPWATLLGTDTTGTTGIPAATDGSSTARAGVLTRGGTGTGWVLGVLDAGAVNQRAAAKIASAVTGRHALVFNVADPDNFLYLQAQASTSDVTHMALKQRKGGATITLALIEHTAAQNDILTVERIGDKITVTANGTVKLSQVFADLPAGTKAGFGQASSSAFNSFWDDFYLYN